MKSKVVYCQSLSEHIERNNRTLFNFCLPFLKIELLEGYHPLGACRA